MYNSSLKRKWDMYAYQETVREEKEMAREQGLAEGKAEGKIEGKIEGKVEGKVEGKAEKALEIARALKLQGLGKEQIASATGLSLKEIQAL